MTSPIPRHNLSIKKVLNRWEEAYRYEVLQEGVRMQLYSIFFKNKDYLLIVHKIAENLIALRGENYTQINGITIYNRDTVFDKYNLQILTDFAKISLSDYTKKITDRVMKLSEREFALLLKTFISVLHDMVLLKDNLELFQYIKTMWDNNLFGAFYLNDNFEVKVNLLPPMSKISSFEWSLLFEPFDENVGIVFEKVVASFVAQICSFLPMKKTREELIQLLPTLQDNSERYWEELYVLPPKLMATIFELVTISSTNYEGKIKQLYNVFEAPDTFVNEVVKTPALKYDYNTKYPKNTLKISDEYNFYRLLYNLGLDEVVNLYFPEELTNVPKTKIDTNEIESLVIQMVDISILIIYDMVSLSFNSLKNLTLQACGITSESLNIILKWNALDNLETLDFSGTERYNNLIGNKGCSLLAECDKLKNLKELNLACCKIDDLALSYLCSSPHLENLEKIDLSLNKLITKEGFRMINESTHLKKLNTLVFLCGHVGDENLAELLKPSPCVKKYKSLNLCECQLTKDGLETLCQSESTKTLEELFADANSFNGLLNWKAQKPLPALKKLSVQFCSLNDMNIGALFSMLVLENLNYLDVSFNENLKLNIEEVSQMKNLKELFVETTLVDQDILTRLCVEDKAHGLEKLSLRRGVNYSNLFEKIAKKKLLPNLNFLSMNRVSDFQYNLFFLLYPYQEASNNLETLQYHAGLIDALLWKSSLYGNLYFSNLSELKLVNLVSNGNNALALITKSEKLERLKVLEMSACSVGDLGMSILTKQERLKSLKRLVLRVNTIKNKAIIKFLSSKTCYRLEYLDVAQGVNKSKKQIKRLRVYKEKYQPALVFDV